MRREVIEERPHGLVEMRVHVDSSETDELNAAERRAAGLGFTAGRTMRKIANIDEDEFNALLKNMDKDALDFEASGRSDSRHLRRLLSRFPAWRCSEGGI